MPDNSGLLVTEFLRPDNSKSVQFYDAPDDVVEKAERLKQAGYELCCDLYTNDAARVYIYNPVGDFSMSSMRIPHYVIADVKMTELIREFDLDKYL